MAAKAVVRIPLIEHGEPWERFQCFAEQRVKEGNMVAGEALWEVVCVTGAGPRLTIRSTRNTDDALECSLDPESGILTCTPCLAGGAGPWRLQLRYGGTPSSPGCEESACSIYEAVDWILDELVWLEGRTGESPAQARGGVK